MNDLSLVPMASKPLIVLPSFAILTSIELTRGQKVVVACTCAGVVAVGIAARYLRRRRKICPTKSSLLRHDSSRAARRHKPLTILSPSGEVHSLGAGSSSSPGWNRSTARQSGSSVCGDSITSSGHHSLRPDTTPQQLGALGMEALNTALGCFEDALDGYSRSSHNHTLALTTHDEAEFIQSLQAVIDDAYSLQDRCEHLFLHEHSVLFRCPSSPDRDASHASGGGHSGARRTLTSASSMESFVSAQGDIADLRDLDDFDESQFPLYLVAVRLNESVGIPFRELRTEEVQCASDAEYVCKVHCIRLASQLLFSKQENKDWFIESGRHIIADLMIKAGKDPKEAVMAYDAMLEYLDSCDWGLLEEELRGRGVVAITFYDVVLDFILLDAFEDLDKPPSSVTAVVQNRWLSNSFKESALSTAVWSILKAKRRMLKHQDGFIAHFYDITEHISPVLALGFLGPDEELKQVCTYFKEQIMSLLYDMFSFTSARYTSVEELACDLLRMTHERFTLISKHMALT
ncbi:mitoguardin isoform X2 [Hyalella azteca]|nr:mitoguardin isoform X2 [Hyalella azteca]XP_047737289.1 mitoguardin isoform X2 [Hyalella azteca]XP_047737290.1 mitoguardin isoform X2 [Hyalella azteca]XP_047737291.1 mitoguardin isoform X2 [Hyalella azteca]